MASPPASAKHMGVLSDYPQSNRLIRCLFLGLLLITTPTCAEVPEKWDLSALMQTLAQAPQGQTRFTERKTVSLLKEPLTLTGTLSYRRPSWLEKHVLTPFDERYTVDGDTLTIDNPSQQLHKSLSLSSYPALWAFVESIRAPLAGDLSVLQQFYRISLGGTERNWLLALVPVEPEMAKLVRLIRLKGSGNRISRVEIDEANGDSSVMLIEPPK
jgi:outer membrane lipoprotein-sorting protein